VSWSGSSRSRALRVPLVLSARVERATDSIGASRRHPAGREDGGGVRMLPPSKMGSRPTGFAGSLTPQSVPRDSNSDFSAPNGGCCHWTLGTVLRARTSDRTTFSRASTARYHQASSPCVIASFSLATRGCRLRETLDRLRNGNLASALPSAHVLDSSVPRRSWPYGRDDRVLGTSSARPRSDPMADPTRRTDRSSSTLDRHGRSPALSSRRIPVSRRLGRAHRTCAPASPCSASTGSRAGTAAHLPDRCRAQRASIAHRAGVDPATRA
jgi:hypothetical protein